MSAARFGLRAFPAARQPFTRQTQQNFSRFFQRRTYSSATETPAAVAPPQSGLAKLWNSPVGPKTVHFWAPIMKWGLVLAGAADFARPASQLSLTQNAALTATGAIWTRWCFVIRPQNIFLASVNFLLFCVGATQVGRVLSYQNSIKGEAGMKDEVKKEGKVLEEVLQDPVGAAKKAVNPK